MMRIKRLGWLLIAVSLNGQYQGLGADPTPNELIEHVETAYQTLSSYRGEIRVSRTIKIQRTEVTTVANCSMRMEKPDLYLITWASESGGVANEQIDYTLWREGEGVFLYSRLTGNYYPMKNDGEALASAAGLSGGAMPVVLSLLFDDDLGGVSSISRLEALRLLPSEVVAGDECYVVAGHSLVGVMKITLWISKENYWIRKCATSLNPDGRPFDLEAGLNAGTADIEALTGRELPEEQVELFENLMEQSREMLKSGGLHVDSIEESLSQTSAKLDADDLRFIPPEGAVLKESMLADSFAYLGDAFESLPAEVREEMTKTDFSSLSSAEKSEDLTSWTQRSVLVAALALVALGIGIGVSLSRRGMSNR